MLREGEKLNPLRNRSCFFCKGELGSQAYVCENCTNVYVCADCEAGKRANESAHSHRADHHLALVI